MKTITYYYSAYTHSESGITFDTTGSLEQAIKLAKKYAKEAFPRWIKGYGPKVVVRTPEGETVFEQRM